MTKPLDDAATMARILAAIDPDYPGRDEHAANVFAIVRAARRRWAARLRRGIHRVQEPVA